MAEVQTATKNPKQVYRRAKAYNGGEGYAGTQTDSSGIETSRMLPYSGVMHQKAIRYYEMC